MPTNHTPVALKDAQLFLEECIQSHELVSLVALTADGEIRRYVGWQVLSSWYMGGTHTLVNPRSGRKRKVRDVLIFELNGHPVFL